MVLEEIKTWSFLYFENFQKVGIEGSLIMKISKTQKPKVIFLKNQTITQTFIHNIHVSNYWIIEPSTYKWNL
jgi:hypothetical protein